MKSKSAINRNIRELTSLSDNGDMVERRIAQAMRDAIQWTSTKTVGWGSMKNEARQLAQILKNEIDSR